MAVVTMVVMVVLAFVMPEPFGVPDRIGLVVFGAIVAGLLHLVGRPKVTATQRGLEVQNALRRHTYEWPEVVRVNMNVGEPWPTLDLADGSSVGAMGIQGSERERCAKAIGELRTLLKEHGEAPDR